MATAARSRYTPDEYLALERKADSKSELIHGEIHAMAGASRGHNLIASNLNRVIGNALRDQPCEVYSSDMRVAVSETGLYTYPDVVAVCGTPEFRDGELDTLLNPTLIIEVLSPSTEANDRGYKFAHYRRLGSLREYLLVAQDRPAVERYTRRGDDWLLTEVAGLDASLRLASIDAEIPLAEVYAKLSFPPEGSNPGSPPLPGGRPRPIMEAAGGGV